MTLSPAARTLMAAGLLLLIAWLAGQSISREDLWWDEAWTAWAVEPRDLREVVSRVRDDVHPPLYFLMMNGWRRIAGDTELALRYPALFFGLMGLATTYALGKRWFGWRTGLLTLIVLGSSGFFIYYAREARMYTLMLLLAGAATLLYWRWLSRLSRSETNGIRAGLAYGLLLTALVYTHYAGWLIVLTHLIHLIFTSGKSAARLWRFALPYGMSLLLFLPWLPIVIAQLQVNPNGSLAVPVPTNTATLIWLVHSPTADQWGLIGSLLLAGVGLGWRYRATRLLVIWLLLTPAVLLALNAWVLPVYQIRYVIAVLPALALLSAAGIDHLSRFPRLARWHPYLPPLLVIVITGFWLGINQTNFRWFWAAKPDWTAPIQQVIQSRQPLEPIITDLAAHDPAAYYADHLGLRSGLALDLSWRLHHLTEIHQIVERLNDEPVLWVALPSNTAKSWQIMTELDRTRQVSYRASYQNIIFYRFEGRGANDLAFQFGEQLALVNAPTAEQLMAVQPGAEVCATLELRALQTIDERYSIGLHLVDWTGNRSIAGWDGGLGAHHAGDSFSLTPCLTVPSDALPGYHYLQWIIYDWSTLQRLPVIEASAEPPLTWGEVMVLAAVDVIGE